MAGAILVMGQSAFGQNVTLTGTAFSPANASASFRMLAAGMAQSAPTSGTFSDEFRWLTGSGEGFYWVRAIIVSGTFTAGTAGSWLQLNTTRTWSRNRTSDVAGTTTVVATLEIALDSAGALIVASFTLTLNAEVII